MSTTTQKKGTAKTEAIIGTGVSKLGMALTSIVSACEVFKGLDTEVANKSLEIAAKEDQLAALDVAFAEKERQLKVRLDLDMKEATMAVVSSHLSATNKIAVDRATYVELQKEVEELTKDNKSEVDGAVAIATNSLKKHYEGEIKLKDAENATKEATNIATIKSLQDQLAAIKADRDMWKQALDEERKASVQRAQAASIGTLNVGSAEGNRR